MGSNNGRGGQGIQRNLSNTDTFGTKAIVLISEVSFSWRGSVYIKLRLSQCPD